MPSAVHASPALQNQYVRASMMILAEMKHQRIPSIYRQKLFAGQNGNARSELVILSTEEKQNLPLADFFLQILLWRFPFFQCLRMF